MKGHLRTWTAWALILMLLFSNTVNVMAVEPQTGEQADVSAELKQSTEGTADSRDENEVSADTAEEKDAADKEDAEAPKDNAGDVTDGDSDDSDAASDTKDTAEDSTEASDEETSAEKDNAADAETPTEAEETTAAEAESTKDEGTADTTAAGSEGNAAGSTGAANGAETGAAASSAASETTAAETSVEETTAEENLKIATSSQIDVRASVVDEFGNPIADKYTDMELPKFKNGELVLNDVDNPPVAKVRVRKHIFKVIKYKYVQATIDKQIITGLKKKDTGTKDPDTNDEVFAYYYSTDDGQTWIELTEDTTVYFVYSDSKKTTYSYEDEFVAVTATLQYANAIPADAEFVVTEVTPDTNGYNYDAYMEALNGAGNSNTDGSDAQSASDSSEAAFNEKNTLLYDIAFLAAPTDEDGNDKEGKKIEYQPAEGSVNISISFKQKQLKEKIAAENEAEIKLVHLPLTDSVKESVSTTADATEISAADIKTEVISDSTSISGEKIDFNLNDFSLMAISSAGEAVIKPGKSITFKDALGDAWQYSVVANELSLYGHMETNFATGVLHLNANVQACKNSGGGAGETFIGAYDGNNFKLDLNGNEGYLKIYTTETALRNFGFNMTHLEQGDSLDKLQFPNGVIVDYSSYSEEEIKTMVKNMVDAAVKKSGELAGSAKSSGYNYTEVKDQYSNVIDIAGKNDAEGTYYIDFKEGEFPSSGYTIKIKTGQNVVLNIPDDEVHFGQFTLVVDDKQHTTQANSDEDIICESVIFNCPNATKATTKGATTGTFIVPNATFSNDSVAAGFLIADKIAKIGGQEWHSISKKIPVIKPDTVRFQASKTVDGETPTADQRFKFNLDELTDNGWKSIEANVKNGTEVTDESEEPETNEDGTTELEDLGEVQFKEITYNKASDVGTHWYRITEDQTQESQYQLDKAQYLVKVVVTKKSENGKIIYAADKKTYYKVKDAEKLQIVRNVVSDASEKAEELKARGVSEIEVQLQANGENSGDAVKLNEKNGWKHEWTNLPETKTDGETKTEIEYTVTVTNASKPDYVETTNVKAVEEDDKAIEKVASDAEFTFNNTSTKKTKTSFTANKTVDGNAPALDQRYAFTLKELHSTKTEGNWQEIDKAWNGAVKVVCDASEKIAALKKAGEDVPDEIKILLKAGDEEKATATLNDDNDWKQEWTDLAWKDAENQQITYTVVADTLLADCVTENYLKTTVKKPKNTGEVQFKEIEYGKDADLGIHWYQITEDQSQKTQYELDKSQYLVKVVVSKNEDTKGNISYKTENSYYKVKDAGKLLDAVSINVDASAAIAELDAEDVPKALEVQLEIKGNDESTAAETVTLDAAHGWKASLSKPTKDASGNRISYTAEVIDDELVANKNKSELVQIAEPTTTVNEAVIESVENDAEFTFNNTSATKTSFTATKTVDDKEPALDQRYAFTLEELSAKKVTLDESVKAGSWTTVDTAYNGAVEVVCDASEKIKAAGDSAPQSITVQLKAGNQNSGEAVTLNDKNGWKHEWTNLAWKTKSTNNDGKETETEISYSVVAVEGDDAQTDNSASGYLTTNITKPSSTGAVQFKEIEYGAADVGTHWYKITEETVEGSKLTQDKSQYLVKVVVTGNKDTDGEGTSYSVEKTYYRVMTNNKGELLEVLNWVSIQADASQKIAEMEAAGTEPPKEIAVQLEAGENNSGDAVKLSAANDWKCEWDVPSKDESGKEISYSVSATADSGNFSEVTTTKAVTVNTEAVVALEEKKTPTFNNTSPEVATTSVIVKKDWQDGNNQDGLRPESVQAKLYKKIANDQLQEVTEDQDKNEISAITLSENNNWTASWSNLPKKDGETDISYTVQEVDAEADGKGTKITFNGNDNNKKVTYTVNYSDTTKVTENGKEAYSVTITNSYTPKTRSIKVKKSWADGNKTEQNLRPQSITVQLYADDQPYKINGKIAILTLYASAVGADSWTGSWNDLPVNKDGKEIKYTVKEAGETDKKVTLKRDDSSPSVEYEVSYNTPPVNGDETFVITNTYKKTTVSISKKALSGENELEGATLELASGSDIIEKWKSGKEAHELELADGTYTLIEETAPNGYLVAQYISFKVENKKVYLKDENGQWKNQAESTNLVTMIDRPIATTSVIVKKDWKDANDENQKRPDSVNVELYTEKNSVLTEVADSKKTLQKDDDWTASWSNLPKTDANGNSISYVVREVDEKDQPIAEGGKITLTKTAADGTSTSAEYSVGYSDLTTEEVNGKDAYSITITNTYKLKEIEFSKVIAGQNEELAGAMLQITSGSDIVRKWTSDGNTKKFNLPKGTYKLEEVSAPTGYDVADAIVFRIVEDTNGKLKLEIQRGGQWKSPTNAKITMEDRITTRDISVEKIWKGDTGAENLRPSSIKVNLYGNNETEALKTVTIKPDDNGDWSYTFTGLTKYENGEEINYSVTEDIVTDYTGEKSGSMANGFIITNTYNPGRTSVTVSKVDLGGREIAGAKLKISGREIGGGEDISPIEWTSEDGKSHVVNLKPGKYTLTEMQAPNGYLVAGSIGFEITGDGKVKVNGKTVSDGRITMVDDYESHEVKFSKTMVNGTKELAGAVLVVTGTEDSSGKQISESWTSGETQKAISLKPGTYTMAETQAPAGYLVADSITFRVTTEGQLLVKSGESWTEAALVHMEDARKPSNGGGGGGGGGHKDETPTTPAQTETQPSTEETTTVTDGGNEHGDSRDEVETNPDGSVRGAGRGKNKNGQNGDVKGAGRRRGALTGDQAMTLFWGVGFMFCAILLLVWVRRRKDNK